MSKWDSPREEKKFHKSLEKKNKMATKMQGSDEIRKLMEYGMARREEKRRLNNQ